MYSPTEKMLTDGFLLKMDKIYEGYYVKNYLQQGYAYESWTNPIVSGLNATSLNTDQ